MPGRLDGLVGITRLGVGDTLTVAHQVARNGFDQDAVARPLRPKEVSKGCAQGHAQVAQD